MNRKNICVFDTETLSVNPNTTDIIQLSALMIEPIKLQVIKSSEFNSYCRPDGFNNDDDTFNKWKSTIEFHLKNQRWTRQQFMEKIVAAPPEKIVWQQFTEYLKKYHTKASSQTIFTAPILAGWNIFGFDMKIIDRLCRKYKNVDKNNNPNIYLEKELQDIMKIIFLWFENSADLNSCSMDAVREYLGIEGGGAHEGLKDVRDEAAILIKFLNLHRYYSPKVQFRDSFKKKNT